ncbi:MAG TPA: DUF72 domain-containing protein [Nitrososphaerales archaeon]|nr:DUF72 domain-containing protein [Nitrososphaerales archaeon]
MQAFLEPQTEAVRKQKLYVGCISWTYPDWNESFYPAGAKSSELLNLYSKIFDIVEVDSSFYRIPSSNAVKQWKERTHSHFKFTVKLPKRISHEAKLQNIDKELEHFENTILGLGEKLACVFVQLPSSSKFGSDFSKLESFLEKTNPALRYAIEFRNKSWLVDETYNLLARKKICIVWGVGEHIDILPKLTTDFVYLRFMGDFNEFQKFDRIQKDKTEILQAWWENLSKSMEKLASAFVLVSNHFAGFAPESANQFRKCANLNQVNWREIFSRTGQH